MGEPDRFGAWRVVRELGRGGMGVVFEVAHDILGRRAAVKVLRADVARDAGFARRFVDEARATSAIHHPGIVEILDVADDGDQPYIVMELLEGESLATSLRRRRMLSVADAVRIASATAGALGAAHAAGIVHRDLKPDNIFLVYGDIKLLDFGVAKLLDDHSHTQTGALLGTPQYMSPEQCEGAREVDHRSDLYSLGCVLFEMLAGKPPFQSSGVGGLIGMHLHVAPPALRGVRPDAPVELEDVVARLLAKQPDERYRDAGEVVAALARVPLPPSAEVTPVVMTPSVNRDAETVSSLATPAGREVVVSRATPPPDRRSRRGLWIGALGVAAGAGVTFALVRGTGGDPPAAGPVDAAVPVVAAIDAAVDAAVVIAVPPDARDDLVAEAERLLESGDLAHAMEYADVAHRIHPDDPDATAIWNKVRKRRAEEEAKKRDAVVRDKRLASGRPGPGSGSGSDTPVDPREHEVEMLLRQIAVVGNDHQLMAMHCQRIAALSVARTPFERCVVSMCAKGGRSEIYKIVNLAPAGMRQRLLDMCPVRK